MCERVGECLGQRFPVLLDLGDRFEAHHAVAVVKVVHEYLGVCAFLLSLHAEPVGHAVAALLAPEVRHGEVKIA